MSRILVLSIIVASLSTIVGCGASSSANRLSTTPSGVNVAEVRDEACWTPPGETLSINDAKAPAAATPAREKMKSSYRPNREARPTSGAVHAATY